MIGFTDHFILGKYERYLRLESKKTFYSLRDIASLDKGFLDNFLSNKSIRALAFGSFDNISLRTQAEFLVIFKLIQRTN